MAELGTEERQTLQEAVAAFNRHDYYAAHDLFEELWGEDLFKGLVQAAVALHHWSVGNLKGIEGLPGNVSRILARYRPEAHGLDLDGFLEAFHAYMKAIERGQRPDLQAAPRLTLNNG